ncbi:hypothetical protein CBR_g27953 [Chara braunii]|uniref:AAA+ ATPase domain-containing protein n=1 Tax=Chara braunii TaxID=69332 RepID=A0A388L8X3_CHABU|nr:hypothetical protein CBR_g27953 [Chara braunii]|eukprot:GBG78728.1 hypothetical protein CBR_g27953 [Chara braunii]
MMIHQPSPATVIKKKWRFVTRRISGDETFLLSMLRDTKVPHAVVPQPPSAALRNVLYTIFALWIPLVPLLLFFRRAMGGSDSASKAKKRLQRDVKFSDVAGVDEAKAELEEAVAGEAGIPFLAASASEFVELFVGRGAARVRELFTEARKVAPSIVFIDELDAVGGKRGTSFNEERDQTLNQLLTEMDGFESDTGVIVLAATNRPESLDPALCRAGRISRRVYVGAPDLKGREEILAVHLRKVKVQGPPERICRIVALATPRCAGADLANIVNEAALLAARNGRDAAEMEDFLEAVDRALYGVGGKKDWRKGVKRQLDKWLGMDSVSNFTDSKDNISRQKQLPWNRNQGPGINVATTQ